MAALEGGGGRWTLGGRPCEAGALWPPSFPSQPPAPGWPLAGAQLLSRLSLLAQCISPGVVETQFAFKLHDKDPEKAAATYEHMEVGPSEATHSLNESRGCPGLQTSPF